MKSYFGIMANLSISLRGHSVRYNLPFFILILKFKVWLSQFCTSQALILRKIEQKKEKSGKH